MRIGFDAKRAFLNSTGLGNYSRDSIRLLSHFYTDNKYFLYTPKEIKNSRLAFLKNRDKYSGCTVHLVTPKLDSGKIILQKKILIDKNETEKSLKTKILRQEHKLYPQSIISVFR